MPLFPLLQISILYTTPILTLPFRRPRPARKRHVVMVQKEVALRVMRPAKNKKLFRALLSSSPTTAVPEIVTVVPASSFVPPQRWTPRL